MIKHDVYAGKKHIQPRYIRSKKNSPRSEVYFRHTMLRTTFRSDSAGIPMAFSLFTISKSLARKPS